jgi:hypothetical protein
MYTVDNYISTSVEDARINLNNVLKRNPAEAKRIACSVLQKIEGTPGHVTRISFMKAVIRKAEKTLSKG